MIIFLIGDSITQGYWDTKGGWADRIKAEVFRRDLGSDFRYYHGVHNLGVDGNTTRQVIDRFEHETNARFWRDSEYGVVVAVGTNDTVVSKSGKVESDPETYHKQLDKLLSKAKQITNNIAFVNLLPVDESLTNPLPSSSTGKSYTNERITAFNQALEKFSKENDIKLIDMHSVFVGGEYEKLFADGLHPNDEGHELIFQNVMPVIEEWLYRHG